MKRSCALAVLALLLAAPILAGGGAPTYNLRRTPEFKPGDKIKTSSVEVEATGAAKADGSAAQKSTEKTTVESTYEVLTADKTGRVLTFRKTLVAGKQEFEDSRFRKPVTISLRGLIATAASLGKNYTGDPASLCSPETEKLDAPQVAFVRDEFLKKMSFAGQRRADRLLMPAKPVAVGHKWKLNQAQLQAWLRAIGKFSGPAINPRSAELEIVSVKKGIAAIRGVLRVEGNAGGHRFTPELKLSCSIDLATGVWTERELGMVGKDNLRGVNVTFVASKRESMTLTRGKGSASDMPAKVYKLGWPHPGADKNRFANATLGVSIDAPAGHKHTGTTRKGRTLSIRFEAGNRSNLSIHMQRFPYPLQLKTSVELLERSLTGTPGTKVTARKKLRLPLGQPAMLIETESKSGLVVSRLLIAADGQRIVGINAAAPKREAKQVAALDKALRSLRLYDPNPFTTGKKDREQK